jgi:sulfite reductase alpha subunit-like flavoprotein
MAVTDYQTPFKRKKLGVCSFWLSSLIPDLKEEVPIWFSKGTMKLPQVIDGIYPPIIMVGPGTGIAAFRSFI